MVVYVDGLAMLACRRHAELAAGAGGFAVPVASLPGLIHGGGDADELRAQLMAGHYYQAPEELLATPQLPEARKVVEPIHIEVSADGVTITRAGEAVL
jgi:hypothetical protein